MVLPEDGVGLPEGAAMDWAHLHSVQSPYAVRLQREAQREVGVETEEDDSIDERARVLRDAVQRHSGLVRLAVPGHGRRLRERRLVLRLRARLLPV